MWSQATAVTSPGSLLGMWNLHFNKTPVGLYACESLRSTKLTPRDFSFKPVLAKSLQSLYPSKVDHKMSLEMKNIKKYSSE